MAKFIHVVTKVPKQSAKLFPYAKTVLKALTGNAYFPSVDLTALTARIKTLDAAETAAAHKEPGAAATCAAARESVREELEYLRSCVQRILEVQAGTADLNAIKAMAESAAMSLRKVATRAKAVFAVMYGVTPGSVKLTAPASRTRDTHEWQHSGDQLTWTVVPSTRQAKTTVTGLPVGATLHFRHRTLTKDGYTEWSDPTLMIVIR